MRVAERRNTELTTAQQKLAERDEQIAERDAELEGFRAAARAEQEERDLEAQYSALKERFEPSAPTPRGVNPPRGVSQEPSEPWVYEPGSKGFPT
jgi:uncharacterized protein (DUF3084 family)